MIGDMEPAVATATLPFVQPDAHDYDGKAPLDRAHFSVQTRAEAEYLLNLDHSNGQGSPEWRAFFVESLVEFLVWQNQPWGLVAESDVDWLIGLVADAPSPSVPALVFALVREMNEAPERLITLALKLQRGRLIG